ncbi:MAG: carbohydrate ABC transporter permease, partial [Lentisphaeria bacterium]|nr:carbohydrate ABC transporter permease [Lentisphaeria bacterium]
IRHPKSDIPNPTSQIRHPKSDIPNPTSEIRHPKSDIRNPKSQIPLMSIISKIGRRHPRVRALYVGMYTFLILGALTMVYPFMLMISGSTKSNVDIKYFDIVPRFLYDDLWLHRKHQEALFNESVNARDTAYETDDTAFDFVDLPSPSSPALLAAWNAFLDGADLPEHTFTIGHLACSQSRTLPLNLRAFKAQIKREHGGDLSQVNRALGARFAAWNAVTVQARETLARRDKPRTDGIAAELAELKAAAPRGMRYYFSVRGYFKQAYLKPLYSRDIAAYNQKHGTSYGAYSEIDLPRTFPVGGTPLEQQDWENFARSTLGLVWIGAVPAAAGDYRDFLKAKHGSIAVLNRHYDADYASFEDIPPVLESPLAGMRGSDWEAFLAGWRDPRTGLEHRIAREHLRINGIEHRFRDYLLEKHGDLAGVNAALGTDFKGIGAITLPQAAMHHDYFQAHKWSLRQEFLTRNYKAVADYLLLHGRGIVNTLVYCALAIALALIINPLAAYAMSRYRMPSTYKILLFCMCTMAFPPMVTAIPNFLILRKLGLLNTFAALVLPGMANGYAIFLLKGFFDSQPRELYESAQLDGASEWTLFWQIAMSLSKPILAVIALQAFTVAYSNFMFAFVVCQDEKMWTLMVWLYQLQQRSGQAVMYASLIIAAIPTFLIFLFCQNIIMRGIVVPAEK